MWGGHSLRQAQAQLGLPTAGAEKTASAGQNGQGTREGHDFKARPKTQQRIRGFKAARGTYSGVK